MFKVYSNDNSILVNHMKNILNNHNINCFIKNENLQGAGVAAIGAFCTELWVDDVRNVEKAENLIKFNLDNDNSNSIDWNCQSCGETNEEQFMICWSCSHSKVNSF